MTATALDDPRPLVLITGAAGGVGSALAAALADDYTVVGLDREGKTADIPLFGADLGRQDSIDRALDAMAAQFGTRIASVIHLAAYFDFTGEENPLYDEVNVQGTRRLLDALQRFEVGQFVYSGTMLVHRAGGKQMVVVAAGGHGSFGTTLGDAVVAFVLD